MTQLQCDVRARVFPLLCAVAQSQALLVAARFEQASGRDLQALFAKWVY